MQSVVPVVEESSTVLSPASYHVFEYRGDRLLYDLATGTVCELNEFSYRLLSLCGSHAWTEVLSALEREYPGVGERDVRDILDTLKARGLFASRSPDLDDQHENIDALWNHKPRRLQLFLSQTCNLACQYCYAESNGSNARHVLMSWRVAKATVDYFVRRSGPRPEVQITFFGGEPLLNYEMLRKVVDYCDSISAKTHKKFIFELVCNGTLLNKEIVDYVAERDFLLFVSIDGWREMNNFQRPSVSGKDYYDTILSNARYAVQKYRALKSRLRVKVRANMTAQYHDLRRIAKYLEDQGFDKIGIAPIAPLPYWEDLPCYALTNEQVMAVDSQYEQLMVEALSDMERGQRLPPFTAGFLHRIVSERLTARRTMGIICGIGRNTNAVDCDGNIYPCHRYVGMTKYILGNVFHGLSPSQTIGMYHKYNRCALKQCTTCWARAICAGGCPWERSSPDGVIYDRKPEECQRLKNTIQQYLWLDKEMRKRCPAEHSRILTRSGAAAREIDNWQW